MDHHFLTEVAEAFLVTNDVYSKFSSKQIKQIRERITEEVMSLVKDLRETDIELYDMLWDRSKIFQQQVITDYLTLSFCDEETINEIGVLSTAIVSILSTLVTVKYGNKITNTIMKAVGAISKKLESLGKFLVKLGRHGKFRYVIIQRNVKQCYQRCGIKPEDISGLHYLNVGKGLPISTKKSKNQAQCLQECFVLFAIENIALLMNYYFICVKKQNQFQNVENLKPDAILKIASGVPLAGVCKEYFDEVKESFDNFYDLLDVVYTDDQEKQKAISKLRDRVIQVRNEIGRTKDFKKFN